MEQSETTRELTLEEAVSLAILLPLVPLALVALLVWAIVKLASPRRYAATL